MIFGVRCCVQHLCDYTFRSEVHFERFSVKPVETQEAGRILARSRDLFFVGSAGNANVDILALVFLCRWCIFLISKYVFARVSSVPCYRAHAVRLFLFVIAIRLDYTDVLKN